jgi:hypothetical protein
MHHTLTQDLSPGKLKWGGPPGRHLAIFFHKAKQTDNPATQPTRDLGSESSTSKRQREQTPTKPPRGSPEQDQTDGTYRGTANTARPRPNWRHPPGGRQHQQTKTRSTKTPEERQHQPDQPKNAKTPTPVKRPS